MLQSRNSDLDIQERFTRESNRLTEKDLSKIAKAYRELQHLGIVSAEHGSGCYIAPGGRTPDLPMRQKKAKLAELCARIAAEARSHGISLDELVEQLNQQLKKENAA